MGQEDSKTVPTQAGVTETVGWDLPEGEMEDSDRDDGNDGNDGNDGDDGNDGESSPTGRPYRPANYVLLSDLAQEFGLDRSYLRKYVLRHGYKFVRVRTPESRWQLTLALTPEDADAIRALRRVEGYTGEIVREYEKGMS